MKTLFQGAGAMLCLAAAGAALAANGSIAANMTRDAHLAAKARAEALARVQDELRKAKAETPPNAPPARASRT